MFRKNTYQPKHLKTVPKDKARDIKPQRGFRAQCMTLDDFEPDWLKRMMEETPKGETLCE